jgi:hypothetical protein
MKRKASWGWVVPGIVALASATAFAQPSQTQQPTSKPPSAQQHASHGQLPQVQQRALSEKSQIAIARLHALNLARESFARAAADAAEDEQVRSFMLDLASDYARADGRLTAFAEMYGVDVESTRMQEVTRKVAQTWNKENERIAGSRGPEAARLALSAFIDRNEGAVNDLRTLRGEVQEEVLRELINERIAMLEEESTRAQQLRGQMKQQTQTRSTPSTQQAAPMQQSPQGGTTR